MGSQLKLLHSKLFPNAFPCLHTFLDHLSKSQSVQNNLSAPLLQTSASFYTPPFINEHSQASLSKSPRDPQTCFASRLPSCYHSAQFPQSLGITLLDLPKKATHSTYVLQWLLTGTTGEATPSNAGLRCFSTLPTDSEFPEHRHFIA